MVRIIQNLYESLEKYIEKSICFVKAWKIVSPLVQKDFCLIAMLIFVTILID